MTNVVVVIGAGSIGQAIVRRVSAGKHIPLADLRPDLATAAAKIMIDLTRICPRARPGGYCAWVQIFNRANSPRVMAEAVRFGDLGPT